VIGDIIKIGLLCIVIGGASIPVSFGINSSPWIVWLGNALGSLLSAIVVVYIGDRITSEKFKNKANRWRIGRKIVAVYDAGEDGRKVRKVSSFIDKYGIKIFALFCPIFPGVAISTAGVYILDLDKATFKRWMFGGVVFVSGIYVFGYWWLFVK
jgi:membrane protein DedA with SNARE-associated domain